MGGPRLSLARRLPRHARRPLPRQHQPHERARRRPVVLDLDVVRRADRSRDRGVLRLRRDRPQPLRRAGCRLRRRQRAQQRPHRRRADGRRTAAALRPRRDRRRRAEPGDLGRADPAPLDRHEPERRGRVGHVDRFAVPLGRRDMGHRRPADRTPVVHRQRRRGRLVRPSARHADAGRRAGPVPRDRPHGHLQPGLRGRRRREQPDGLAVHARGHGRRTRDRRAAAHDARRRPGEALPHLGAARPDAPRHAAGRRRRERQRDLPAARRRADVGRLRRDVRGPALQRPHGDRAVDRAGHVLPARPELQGRRRRRAGPAARRTAAARHHRRAHRHGRRQPARDHDDHGRAVPGRRDREARASRDRRIRTARVAGRRQHDDHRDLRLHRRAARPVRREGDQPRRQLGRRAVPLPRGARHRAGGHDRCRRSAGDPRGRPGDVLRRAAEHLEPRRAVHVLRGRRAAAPAEPDRLRAALPRVLHERPRRAGRRCRRPERRRAVGAHGVDRQHDRPARDRGLHLRSRGRRLRRLQLQCHDVPGPEGTPRPCVRGLPLEDGRVLPGPRRHARRRRSGHRQLVGSREGQGGRGRARTRCRDGPDRLRRDVQRERGRAGQVRDPVHPVPLPRVRGGHDDDARRVRRVPVAARARPAHGVARLG